MRATSKRGHYAFGVHDGDTTYYVLANRILDDDDRLFGWVQGRWQPGRFHLDLSDQRRAWFSWWDGGTERSVPISRALQLRWPG